MKSSGVNRLPRLPRLALAIVLAMIAAWMSARRGPSGPVIRSYAIQSVSSRALTRASSSPTV